MFNKHYIKFIITHKLFDILSSYLNTYLKNKLILICRNEYDKYLEDKYDFTTVEGIMNIPIPDYSNVKCSTPCYNIEYNLNSRATTLKKTNPELAIACLRKANEIYFHSNFVWQENNYMRIVEFLKDYGRFDEARAEKEFIEKNYLTPIKNQKCKKDFSGYYDKSSPYYGSDLIESSDETFVCSECAKYTKRWFSEFGKNPKYPILPQYFKEHLKEHEHCAIHFSPVLDNISQPAWNYKGDFVRFCNRPFCDERTEEQKKTFDEHIIEIQRKLTAKEEYDWLRENLPNDAPKSLSGYSKMKNANSTNYMKLKTLAEESGKILQ